VNASVHRKLNRRKRRTLRRIEHMPCVERHRPVEPCGRDRAVAASGGPGERPASGAGAGGDDQVGPDEDHIRRAGGRCLAGGPGTQAPGPP
jgi:hypothetical protein